MCPSRGTPIAISSCDVVSLTGRMGHEFTRALILACLLAAELCSVSAWSLPARIAVVAPLSNTRAAAQLDRTPAHISEFTPFAEPMALPRCGDVRPPEALATPDPLLVGDESGLRVRVSFIVGSDGRVHSPFILDSAGTRDDQLVLRAVRRWRYRPALCNGVPTDSEARIQFSLR